MTRERRKDAQYLKIVIRDTSMFEREAAYFHPIPTNAFGVTCAMKLCLREFMERQNIEFSLTSWISRTKNWLWRYFLHVCVLRRSLLDRPKTVVLYKR